MKNRLKYGKKSHKHGLFVFEFSIFVNTTSFIFKLVYKLNKSIQGKVRNKMLLHEYQIRTTSNYKISHFYNVSKLNDKSFHIQNIELLLYVSFSICDHEKDLFIFKLHHQLKTKK